MTPVTRFKNIVYLVLLAGNQALAASLSLDSALKAIAARNPEIAEARSQALADAEAIGRAASPASPRLGLMRENNLSSDQVAMGPMDSWSISQEILFPTKYLLSRAAQKERSHATQANARAKYLEVRQKLVTSYFSVFANKQILNLLNAQREALREIARTAEARRATGLVPQQDEMKAHMEQTKIENQIIVAEQDFESSLAQLRAILDENPNVPLELPEKVETPGIVEPAMQDSSVSETPMLKSASFAVNEANARVTLAKNGYLPDFNIFYRQAYSNHFPNAYSLGIEITVPLWFFAKESNDVNTAQANRAASERRHEITLRQLESDSKTSAAKVRAQGKLLKIYETTLIPQATTTLNSSRAAYRAGRSNFVELLDSERSLYDVRISYFQILAQYADSIARLEASLGHSVSTLPFEDSIRGEP